MRRMFSSFAENLRKIISKGWTLKFKNSARFLQNFEYLSNKILILSGLQMQFFNFSILSVIAKCRIVDVIKSSAIHSLDSLTSLFINFSLITFLCTHGGKKEWKTYNRNLVLGWTAGYSEVKIEKNDIEREYKVYQFAFSQEPPRDSAPTKRCENQNVHD
jgi:hypothetical protein